MGDVKSVQLGDICRFIGGGTPSRKVDSYYIGHIPWATVKDIDSLVLCDTQEKISEEAVENSATNIIPKGTVLVVTRVGLGKVAITKTDIAINQDIKALIPDSRLDPGYLLWSMVAHAPKIVSMGKGSTVKGITLRDLANLPISLLPLPEQHRIVDIMNRADKIRNLREEAQQKAREIIPALFVDMFGDPATNSKGWEVRALGELIQGFEGGKNISAGAENEGGFRILKVSAVTSGFFKPEESKPAPTDYTPPPHHIVRKGDLLFSRANTAKLVGATALVEKRPRNTLLPDKIWRICLNVDEEILPVFLLFYLQSPSVRRELTRMATGTSDSMKNIAQRKLRKLPVFVPPIQLQRNFFERYKGLESTSSLIEDTSALVAEIESSLFAQAFQ